AGLALVIARDRGAQVSGLDASEALVSIARTRLPRARIEVGDMEELPFDNESFDAVTSFTSLQFAGNPIGALKEARRVLRSGGRIGVYVWGPKEDCEANATMGAIM